MRSTKFRVLVVLLFLAGASCGDSEEDDSPFEPPAPTTVPELFGDVLYRADETEVGVDSVETKSIIAVYFQSPNCSACAQFTPYLINVYDEIIQAGKSFEIVLVSFADSEDDMFADMRNSDMPWLAVPYGGTKADGLVLRYGVRYVPTLVVIDGDANTITASGREDVALEGADAYDDWLAQVQ